MMQRDFIQNLHCTQFTLLLYLQLSIDYKIVAAG